MGGAVAAAENRGLAFATALFEELGRAGVAHVCICPGSRSAPLAVAAARQSAIRRWSFIDERSAGFFALGLAKSSRTPVALVCTSGTAAANFHPAVAEAHHARVPLVVLTADRPPELRDWGAGQTLDQLHLYGSHVRWFAEVATPEASGPILRYARALACRAAQTASARPAGPVHLNLPFREPLEPRVVVGDVPPDLAASDALAAEGRADGAYLKLREGVSIPDPEDVARLAERLSACERGIVACGPLDASPALASAVAELAARLAWPVFAEPTSQLRRGPHVETTPLLSAGDWLLRDDAFAEAHRPECVLRVGAPPTSKALRLWIERHPPSDLVLLDPEATWSDPNHLASEIWSCDPRVLCEALTERVETRGASGWRDGFLAADARATRVIERELVLDGALLEGRAVRELAAAIPDGALLYVSNSLPIRDLDGFLPASSRPMRVLCNRGVNGIDGMVSSALGAGAAHAGTNVLLTGDLALLHDVQGLMAARRHGLSTTIVVFDNDGGGIFSHLPIASYGDAVGFDAHFRTPHGLDLGPLVQSLGVGFTRVTSWEHFRAALKEAFAATGTHVVVVPIDPEENLARQRAIEAAVSAALASGDRGVSEAVTHRIDAAGVHLHVVERGAGAPVLILHGFTGSSQSMSGVARRLAPSFRTFTVDLIGHGRSDAPTDPDAYSMASCLAQLCAALDALNLSRVHLLGYSMGGRVALSLCANHPERVASALLVGASAGLAEASARAERRRADAAWAARIEDEGLAAFVDAWMAQPLFASQQRLGATTLAEARAERLANRPHGLALSLGGMGTGAQPPLHAHLAEIDVPICLAVGDEDEKFRGIAQELARRLPRAELAWIPEAGHAAHLENPDAFSTVARRFFLEAKPRDSEKDPHPMTTAQSAPNWKTVRSYEDIRYEKSEDGLAKITICRPEVRNAFRPKTLFELIDAFARVREDPKVGVVLFTGEGPDAFCSGGDQRVRGDAGYVGDDGVPRLNALDLQRVIRSLPKPVIALVAGYAIGGGHVLHLLCDLTIAADNARFGQTGPRVGSFDAGFGASYMARIVGQKKAREIWFLCRQYDARQALDMGLVNEVVPLDELEATGVQWGREILRNSPIAIRCLKAAFNADCDGQAGIQELAGNATMLFYMSEEAQEGRDAFVEKRPPDFSKFPWRP